MPKLNRYLIGLLYVNLGVFGGSPSPRPALTLRVPAPSPEIVGGDVPPILHISPSPTSMAVEYASPTSVTCVPPCVALVVPVVQSPLTLQQVVDPAVLARLNSISGTAERK